MTALCAIKHPNHASNYGNTHQRQDCHAQKGHVLHGGELLFGENDAVAKLDIFAGVQNLAGVHSLAARGGRGVHMRDKRECSGGLNALRGGERADGVAASAI